MPFFVPSSRKASKLALAAAIMGVGAFGLTAYDPRLRQEGREEEVDRPILGRLPESLPSG